MKLLFAMDVIIPSTVLTSLQPNTLVFLSSTSTPKTTLFVISVKRGVDIYFAKKIERFYAENVTFQSMEQMNIHRNITGFFSLV